MKATTNINMTQAITHPTTGFKSNENAAAGAGQTQGTQAGAKDPGQGKGKPESELRAAARRHGLTLKELAKKMGVSYGYLLQVASGQRPWSPMLRERVMAVLGEVPGQGVVYRQGGLVKGESTFIRERARELGFSLKGLAEHAGAELRLHDPGVPGRKEHEPGGPGAGGGRAGRSGQGRARPTSAALIAASPVGPDGCARLQPERGGPAGRHQLRSSVPGHERPANPVGRAF